MSKLLHARDTAHRLLSFPRLAGLLFAFSPLHARADIADASATTSFSLPMIAEVIVITITLAAWITLIWTIRHRTLRFLTGLAVRHTRGINSKRLRHVSRLRIVQLARIGTRLASLGLILVALFAWGVFLLRAVPATSELAERVTHLILLNLQTLALAAVGALPDLGVVAVIYFIARLTNELLNHYFSSIAEGEVESTVFDPVTAQTTRRLTDIAVWIIAVIVAFPYLPGSDSAAFRGVSVLAGLMLSIGSANLVTQLTSGLSLIYGRSVRPGDYIETDKGEGVVEHIGLLACTLRTARDELVSLPHSTVAAGVKNFSRGRDGVRFAAEVTIGYDAPWRQVRELLLAAAADTPGIIATPAPTVRQAGLEDFYVRYELLFTPENPADRLPLLGRLHEAIQDRFHAAGVQIMSPHYLADPAAPKIPRA